MTDLSNRFITDKFFSDDEEISILFRPGTTLLSNGTYLSTRDGYTRIYDDMGELISDGVRIQGTREIDNFARGFGFAEMANGKFVIAFGKRNPYPNDPDDTDSLQNDLEFRIFDAGGTAHSSILPIHQPSDANDFDLTLAPTRTGFAAAWRSTSDDPDNRFSQGILFRTFDENGFADTPPVFINETQRGYQNDPRMAALTTGDIALVYRSTPFGAEGIENQTLAQVLDENGDVIVGEFEIKPVDVGFHGSHKVTGLADGRFAVIFNSFESNFNGGEVPDTPDVYVQMYEVDRSGAGVRVVESGDLIRVTDNLELAELEPRIVDIAGAGFFATWTELTGNTSGIFSEYHLMGQFFDGAGQTLGPDFSIMTGYPNGLGHDVYENGQGAIRVSWFERTPREDGLFGQARSVTRIVEAPIEAADLDQLIRGDETPNELDGGAGDDTILGLEANDLLRGLDGDDSLEGASGNDTLEGGAGNDTLDGGSGRDRMEGGAGDDTYRVDDRRDAVIEAVGEGIDEVISSAAVILGAAEIEKVTLTGDADVRVLGNGTATEITGNAGSNILAGGGGGDTITGGAGVDYFALQERDAPGITSFTDFGDQDLLALDDQFFGLGDGRVDVRAVDPQVAANALARGTVEYDRATGELRIGGDLVADLGDGTRLGVDDVLLF